jgi:predicted metal-dependent HD superfamily phosphohydrolase
MFLIELERTLIRAGASTLKAKKIERTIYSAHSKPSRHYHNLAHLNNLYEQLAPVREQLQDPDVVVFAIAFHDFCYQVRSTSNERRSAEKARGYLELSGISAGAIQRCTEHILATARHEVSDDPDTNLFTDADLSILGAAPEAYARYAEQVRKEYAIYPDFLYKPGRRKVLEHFLAMDRIFKTDWFDGRYGAQARINLKNELDRS